MTRAGVIMYRVLKMARKSWNRLAIGAVALVAGAAPLSALLLAPRPAGSMPELMLRLPSYQKYRCANCHASSEPAAGSAGLNVFGEDFSANQKLWDRTLAYRNSDGDKCLNGFELGDQNGDGTFDYSGTVVEHSNPGDGRDCSIALTQQTWGKIKDVFRSEIPDYMDPGDLFSDERGGEE
jgi:hypothetical protein